MGDCRGTAESTQQYVLNVDTAAGWPFARGVHQDPMQRARIYSFSLSKFCNRCPFNVLLCCLCLEVNPSRWLVLEGMCCCLRLRGVPCLPKC